MKTKIYLGILIGILLLAVFTIGVIAGGMLPKSDTIITLEKNTDCQAKVTIDNQEYNFRFKPIGADIKVSRDKALKSFLQQDTLINKIEAKNINSVDITSTICDGIETLGEGKITLEIK